MLWVKQVIKILRENQLQQDFCSTWVRNDYFKCFANLFCLFEVERIVSDILVYCRMRARITTSAKYPNRYMMSVSHQSQLSDSCCTSLKRRGLLTQAGTDEKSSREMRPLICRQRLMQRDTSCCGRICHSSSTSFGV